MKKDKKYAYGTGTEINYMENLHEELAQDDINKAKAMYEGESNPLVLGMQAAAGMLINYGMNNINNGDFQNGGMGESLGADIFNDPSIGVAKMGKSRAKGKVEVEGGEVFETQSGKTGEFKGPSHEEGGIDVNLLEPTNIFSDKIFRDGVSMAERKKAREKKLAKIEKKLIENPYDKITKKTYERTKSSFDKEEFKDLQTQQLIGTLMGSSSDSVGLKAEFGLFDWFGNMFNPEEDDGNLNKTFGDLLSLGGNIFSGVAPLLNTLKNRAGDTPNINAYKDFGKDALKANDEAKNYIEGVRNNALKDVDRSNLGAKRKARQSSRSVNTQRATDLIIDQSSNQAKESVYDNFAKQMMQLFSQESQLENQQDAYVMKGEETRDEKDRLDRDAFFTNKAQNLATLGQAIQQTGKDLNQSQQQEIMMKILNQMSKYGITFDSDFTMQNPDQ